MDNGESRPNTDIELRLARLESRLDEMHTEMRRTRRLFWWTWFYTNVFAPLAVIAILVGGSYYAISYIEDRFLDGADLFQEIQKFIEQ